MKRMRQLGLLALAALFATTAAARADVLEFVPSNALVVAKVNNLKGTSEQVAALAAKSGINAFLPVSNDVLSLLKQQAQVTNGLNDAGDLAFVLLNMVGENKEPQLMILAPVSDYAAFLGNFADAKTDGAITEVKFSEDPKPSYITQWGSYAAISTNKESLAAKPDGLSESGPAATELAGKNIVVLVNMKAARVKVLPKLQKDREEIINKLANHLDAKPETQKYVPGARILAGRLLDAAESFLNHCDAVTVGWSISGDGLGSTCLTQFTPDSPWSAALGRIVQSDQSLVRGLPDAKYLAYAGSLASSDLSLSVINDLVTPVRDELTKLGEPGEIALQYIDLLNKVLKNVQGGSVGLLAPADPAQGSLVQMVGVTQGNAQAILEVSRTSTELSRKIAPQSKATFTPNAKTVDGVQFDEVTTEVSGDAADPEMAQAAQIVQFIYGSTGITQYIGKVSDERVLSVSGLDDAGIAKAIEAAKADQTQITAADHVQAVAKRLPTKRFFEAYVPLNNLIASAADVATQRFGFPVHLGVAPDVQPLAVNGSTDQNAIRVDTYLPSELLQTLIMAGMQGVGQVMMQSQQGEQPAAPQTQPE